MRKFKTTAAIAATAMMLSICMCGCGTDETSKDPATTSEQTQMTTEHNNATGGNATNSNGVGNGVKDAADGIGEGVKDAAEGVGEGVKAITRKVPSVVYDPSHKRNLFCFYFYCLFFFLSSGKIRNDGSILFIIRSYCSYIFWTLFSSR